jgi:hypothetical protein
VKAARSEPGWRNGYGDSENFIESDDRSLPAGPSEQRLDEVNACIRRLEEYRDEITEELAELKNITSILVCCRVNLSPERELELRERLLTLYISVRDGALIF